MQTRNEVNNLNFADAFNVTRSVPVGIIHFRSCIDEQTEKKLYKFLTKEFSSGNQITYGKIKQKSGFAIPEELQELRCNLENFLGYKFNNICCERFNARTSQHPARDGLQFSGQVVIVNLLQTGKYVFCRDDEILNHREEYDIDPRDVILLSGEMRYDWSRGVIAPNELELQHRILKANLEQKHNKSIRGCESSLARLRKRLTRTEETIQREGPFEEYNEENYVDNSYPCRNKNKIRNHKLKQSLQQQICALEKEREKLQNPFQVDEDFERITLTFRYMK